MSWFIFSEVMFFAAFFGALFYMRVLSVPWLGDLEHKLIWPDFNPEWPIGGPGIDGAIHADGRVGHPRDQYADPAVFRRHRDVAHWGLLKNNRRS